MHRNTHRATAFKSSQSDYKLQEPVACGRKSVQKISDAPDSVGGASDAVTGQLQAASLIMRTSQ